MSRNIFAQVKTIRGNVDTRLNKLVNYEYDAIVLAKAGLDRLDFFDGELSQFDIKIFDIDSFVPAACQGIIAVEAKKDFKYLEYFQKISDEKTSLQYKIEREILKHLQVNCSELNAVHCKMVDEKNIELYVMYRAEEIKFSGMYFDIFNNISEIISEIKLQGK